MSLTDQGDRPLRLLFLFEASYIGKHVGDGFIRYAVDQATWYHHGLI